MNYRAPQMRGRYGAAHHPQCMCERCTRAYQHHQAQWNACSCEDCQTTKRLMAEQEMRERSVSTINMCEREHCGTMGKQAAMATIRHVPSDDGKVTLAEVCPGCYAEFLAWWETAPTTARPRAYSAPYDPDAAPPPGPVESIPTEELVRALEARPQSEVQRARYIITGDEGALNASLKAIASERQSPE